MTPEIFAQATDIVRVPEGWDHEEYGVFRPFGAWKLSHATLSVWRPTPEELALLIGGGVVVIRTISPEMIPLTIDVNKTRVMALGMGEA